MPKKVKRRVEKVRQRINSRNVDISKLIWGIVIGVIMIASTIGFIMNFNSGQSVKYKDYLFEYSPNYRKFLTRIDGNVLQFSVLPQDVENLSLKFVRTTQILLGFYNLSDDEISQLGFILFDLYNLIYKNILINKINLTNATDLAKLKCDFLTLIVSKNQENITTLKNCIFLPLNSQLIEAVDYIVYRYYNIIE